MKKKVLLITIAFLFHFLSSVSISGMAMNSTKITFIGNKAFFLKTGVKKIAIDALFFGFSGRYVLPENIRDKIKRNLSPFNKIDILLATHEHADHVRSDFVVDYMKSNKNTRFISTKQLIDKMELNTKGFPGIKDSVPSIYLRRGDKKDLYVKNINIKAITLRHGKNPIKHLCFLINMGGTTFFHMGDAAGPYLLYELNLYKIKKEKIDVAFVPYWLLTGEESSKIIKDNINAKHIIAMHLSLRGNTDDLVSLKKKILLNFPEAVIFHKELISIKI